MENLYKLNINKFKSKFIRSNQNYYYFYHYKIRIKMYNKFVIHFYYM